MKQVCEIITGNCTDVVQSVGHGSFDAIVTDPPYGIGYQSDFGKTPTKRIVGDQQPSTEWLKMTYPVMKEGGCLLLFTRWDISHRWRVAIEESGLSVRSEIIWDKLEPGMGDLKSQFAPRHETIWFATKGDGFEFPNGRPKSVFQIGNPVSTSDRLHPTEKPIRLMRALLRAVASPGSRILDPFCGAGSTIIAAKAEQMSGIGIEIDPDYADIARSRVSPASPLFDRVL